MQTFHTAGAPPNQGRMYLATSGCTRKSKKAESSVAIANNSHSMRRALREWAGRSESGTRASIEELCAVTLGFADPEKSRVLFGFGLTDIARQVEFARYQVIQNQLLDFIAIG